MVQTLAKNPTAYHDYEIPASYEAGVVLAGHEVKSVKTGKINLKGSYIIIRGGEAWLINAHITPYQPKNIKGEYEPDRPRKLLLHKKELDYLAGKSRESRLTLVPLRIYTGSGGKVKLEFGIGKSKRKYDKRETLKEKETERKIKRAMRQET